MKLDPVVPTLWGHLTEYVKKNLYDLFIDVCDQIVKGEDQEVTIDKE